MKRSVIVEIVAASKPDVVFHLAAQAGVRYSLENPRVYIESNVNGTFNLLEALRQNPNLIELRKVERWDGSVPQWNGTGPLPLLNLSGGPVAPTQN